MRHSRENPVLGDWWSSLSMNEKILVTAGGLGALGMGGYMLYNYLNYGTVTGAGTGEVVAPGGGGGSFAGSQGGSQTTSASSIMGSIGSSISSFFTGIENALGIGGGGGPSAGLPPVAGLGPATGGLVGAEAGGDVPSGDDSGGVSSEGAGAWLESTTTPEELAKTEVGGEEPIDMGEIEEPSGVTVAPVEISGTPGSETVAPEEEGGEIVSGTYGPGGSSVSAYIAPGGGGPSTDIGDVDSGDDATYAGEV